MTISFKFIHFIIFSLTVIINVPVTAQIVPISDIASFEDYRLRHNLSSDSSENITNCFRSASILHRIEYPLNYKKAVDFKMIRTFQHFQYNTGLQSDITNGSLLPSQGYQSRHEISALITYRKFTFHISPEFILLQNQDPTPLQLDPQDPNYMARYYSFIANNIDQFWRFGDQAFTKFMLGQSYVSYGLNNFVISASNENLWWGPSLRNSLTLSNNASGFPHISFSTSKPYAYKHGSVSFQTLVGKLSNSKFENPDHIQMRGVWPGGIAFKDSLIRLFYGFNIAFSPNFISGLSIGMTYGGINYLNNRKQRLLSFPFFSSTRPISLGSIYLEYQLKPENTEVYAEIGSGDRLPTPVNLFSDSIPLGFTLGLRTTRNFINARTSLYFGFELTRLQLPDPHLIFDQSNPFGQPLINSWYLSNVIRQGYTNNAQLLGAYVGPGGNSQNFNIGLTSKKFKFDFQLTRFQHNNDFYYYLSYNGSYIPQYQRNNRFWADLTFSSSATYMYKKVKVQAAIGQTKSYNYRWLKLDGGFSGPSPISDRKNSHASLSILYYLKN